MYDKFPVGSSVSYFRQKPVCTETPASGVHIISCSVPNESSEIVSVLWVLTTFLELIVFAFVSVVANDDSL